MKSVCYFKYILKTPWTACLSLIAFVSPSLSFADYQKAVEGNEVVKSKLYPRAGRFQVNALQGGLILNQSFINTFLYSGGATYHVNEWHAVNLEVVVGFSADKPERECVENFFYDDKRASAAGAAGPCDLTVDSKSNGTETTVPTGAKGGPFARKPAYMPIRQIDYMVSGNYQWTPVYGKALWFLSSVGYMDFYTNLGLGMAGTTYWPLRTKTASGKDIKNDGTDDVNEFGIKGRPDPLKQTVPVIALGLGNRFFFAKNFLVNLEFKNFTLIGSDSAGATEISNLFAIWGGLGVIF